MDFARRAYDQSSDEEFRSNVLEYDDIQKLVHSDERYDFLMDTTPKRIKFSEAKKLVEEKESRAEQNETSNSNKILDTDSDNHNHDKTKEESKNQDALADQSELERGDDADAGEEEEGDAYRHGAIDMGTGQGGYAAGCCG